ncbi:MAG: hypothetical protein EA426_02105, partial [Spirochaetaceae bacterium]
MAGCIHLNRRVFVLLATAVLVGAACGEYSVYDLLGSQQDGSFAMTRPSIDIVTNAQYELTATGGFTEYSFTRLSGPGEVSVDGMYTAPTSITTGDSI